MIEKRSSAGGPEGRATDSETLPDAYGANVSQRTREEILREQLDHGGQFFARSPDGRTALAYAESLPKLDDELEKLGLSYTDVVVGRVSRADEGEQF